MASPSSIERRIQHVDDALAVAHCHNARIILIRGQLELRHAQLLERGAEELVQRHPQGLVILTIIAPGTPPGDRLLARRFSRMLADNGHLVRHAAVVVEGAGVWARTIRTVLRGVSLLSQSGPPLELRDTVEQALPQLLPYVRPHEGGIASASELLRVVELLREQPRDAEAARAP